MLNLQYTVLETGAERNTGFSFGYALFEGVVLAVRIVLD